MWPRGPRQSKSCLENSSMYSRPYGVRDIETETSSLCESVCVTHFTWYINLSVCATLLYFHVHSLMEWKTFMFTYWCTGAFSKEKMKNYRSLEAYNFFLSGWVHDVVHITTLTSNFIFRARVGRSQRVTEKPHTAWVAVDKDGVVLAAHCTCMAG